MTISDNEERNMSDDVLNIFGETDDEQPEVAETPEQEDPAPENAQPEGEKAENPAESTGENEAEPPAAKTEEEQRNVPYEALRDERTKRQALERRIAEMEAAQRRAHIEAIEDPGERAQAEQQQLVAAAVAHKMHLSRQYAERQYGEAFVQEVVDFFEDPQHAPMSHQFMRAADPFGAAVEYYNAAKALREIGPDPNSYREKLREELKAELMAELSPTKPKAPPRSMASAPAAGGDSNPIGSGFDALFGES
ncbi:hypothetical protein LO749_01820 [Paracoccus denitrificans]|uniref:hypothetical protein n=1 Tax=Paracoccus denitrificans TaxID=266 RepID=UPI001E5F1468|nr:hypothetical protein [Paracoccus denitrificans]UFS65327.1 hypothetical protein LO749_01820 [Paracoccus denitrificans]